MSEYSLQSAALFNPSIVPHPDQDGVPAGALRFVMSLRATGEGHLSSIEFREGLVSADGDLAFDPVSTLGDLTRDPLPALSQSRLRRNPAGAGNRRAFRRRRVRRPGARASIPKSWRTFCVTRSVGPAGPAERHEYEHEQQSVRDAIRWAAHCDYVVEFPNSLALSERVDFSRVAQRAGRHRRRAVRALSRG